MSAEPTLSEKMARQLTQLAASITVERPFGTSERAEMFRRLDEAMFAYNRGDFESVKSHLMAIMSTFVLKGAL